MTTLSAYCVAIALALLVPAPDARAQAKPTSPMFVDINRADRTELERLPGIGPTRAAGILAMRQKLGGRFPRLVDLRRVKGIGRKTLERLKPHLMLGLPAENRKPTGPRP